MRPLITLALIISLLPRLLAEETAVLVYGATPAGIAAALAAARDGDRVLLVEPSERIGGMFTSGSPGGEIRTAAGITGCYREFTKLVERQYSDDPVAVAASHHGTRFEPKVALGVLEGMLAREPNITVWRSRPLFNVRRSAEGETSAIGMAAFLDEQDRTVTVSADVFIDASYEGDLMAAAKVPYRVGTEGRDEFGESLAPAKPSPRIQAVRYQIVATSDSENRARLRKPPGYDRTDYLGILAYFKKGKLKTVFGSDEKSVFDVQSLPLPKGKAILHEGASKLFSLALAGQNLDWPDGGGGAAVREGIPSKVEPDIPFSPTGLGMARGKVIDVQLRRSTGLLYFLQHDEAVPAAIREEASTWGWCRDELTDSSHLPTQIEIPEARRMVGARIFTQKDAEPAPGQARAAFHSDAIAIADVDLVCAATDHEGTAFGGKESGNFRKSVPPFHVPYSAILPATTENLLVPVAASASHVGQCGLNSEAVRMALGEAAGHAAHLARADRTVVQRVRVSKLQALLHHSGAATTYFSDIPADHPDFAAVQWWASLGGFHELSQANHVRPARDDTEPGTSFVGHDAGLDLPIDPPLAERWLNLARKAMPEADLAQLPGGEGSTRGSWIQKAWSHYSANSLPKK